MHVKLKGTGIRLFPLVGQSNNSVTFSLFQIGQMSFEATTLSNTVYSRSVEFCALFLFHPLVYNRPTVAM